MRSLEPPCERWLAVRGHRCGDDPARCCHRCRLILRQRRSQLHRQWPECQPTAGGLSHLDLLPEGDALHRHHLIHLRCRNTHSSLHRRLSQVWGAAMQFESLPCPVLGRECSGKPHIPREARSSHHLLCHEHTLISVRKQLLHPVNALGPKLAVTHLVRPSIAPAGACERQVVLLYGHSIANLSVVDQDLNDPGISKARPVGENFMSSICTACRCVAAHSQCC